MKTSAQIQSLLKKLPIPATGCIHLVCDQCGKKVLDMPRQPFDPAEAVLYEASCDKHSETSYEAFYDASGKELYPTL